MAFTDFRNHKYLSLETFKKSGEGVKIKRVASAKAPAA